MWRDTPVSYQWRRGNTALVNSGNISGTTTDTLTFSGVVDTNAGNYNVVVSGVSGTNAISATATLTVNSPATIVVAPMNRFQHVGENSTLSVTGLRPELRISGRATAPRFPAQPQTRCRS